MRSLFSSIAFALLVPAFVLADEASDIRDKALKALAKDPADLKKLRIHTMKATGTSKINPVPADATYEWSASWPGQIRSSWEWGTGAMKNGITLVSSDDRGWKKVFNATTVELSIEEVNDFRADAYAQWVATLTTLNDVENKLTVGGKGKVGADTVIGLKIARRPFPEITLYFDEKSWLLRKMAYRAREAGTTMSKELIYDGHKEINGLMLPTKQTTIVQGREIFVWSSLEYAFPEKLDAKVFEKP